MLRLAGYYSRSPVLGFNILMINFESPIMHPCRIMERIASTYLWGLLKEQVQIWILCFMFLVSSIFCLSTMWISRRLSYVSVCVCPCIYLYVVYIYVCLHLSVHKKGLCSLLYSTARTPSGREGCDILYKLIEF